MKTFPVFFILSLAGAVTLLNQTLAADPITAVPLHYAMAPGQTNAYSLQIEMQGEGGREAMAGTFLVSTSNVGTNQIGVSVRGQLRPKNVGGRPQMGFMPGYPMPLASYAWGPQSDVRELVMDEHGQVLRQAGDLALPIPLGPLMTSLVQKFPADPTSGWEEEQDVSVLDEPLLQGPSPAFLALPGGFPYMGYNPSRPGIAVLPARQKVALKVTELTPETVVLEKTISLESRMLTGAEPRISASGTGRLVVDRTTGWPKQTELQCTTLVATENLSRRSVVSLHWQLLEGAEREAALAPPPGPGQGMKFTPEELAKLMDQLKSDDNGKRQSGARELVGGRPGASTPELVVFMAKLATDPDDTVRRAALTIVANYGTKANVPLLLKALNEPDGATRMTIAKALGRLKDPRAAEPLAELLASGHTDQSFYRPRENQITEALARLGPSAETAVLSVLGQKSVETRLQACVVLKQIGTKKSLQALKDLTLYPNKELSEAAAEACRSIQARDGK